MLRKEALAKDFDLKQLRQAALGYEQSRKSSGKIKEEQSQDDSCCRMYTEAEVNEMVSRITSGKYSAQYQKKKTFPSKNQSSQKSASAHQYPNCPPHYRPHEDVRCPARTKSCVVCKQKGHFAGARTCDMTQRIRSVSDHGNEASYNFEEEDNVVKCIETIHLLSNSATRDQCTMVQVMINNTKMEMFVDSGCRRTLLPASRYKNEMRQIKESNIKFRPYGTNIMLKCHGVVDARITTESGAKHSTQIYIVDGHMTEPLLGREDALALGILSITKEWRHPSTESESVNVIADDLRAAGISISSKVDTNDAVSPDAQRRVSQLV